MKLVYLIPPSEWKREGRAQTPLSRSFDFEFPLEIISQETSNDLKYRDNRFDEVTVEFVDDAQAWVGHGVRGIKGTGLHKMIDEHIKIPSKLAGELDRRSKTLFVRNV